LEGSILGGGTMAGSDERLKDCCASFRVKRRNTACLLHYLLPLPTASKSKGLGAVPALIHMAHF